MSEKLTEKSKVCSVRVHEDCWEKWQHAAEIVGAKSLNSWIVNSLNAASAQEVTDLEGFLSETSEEFCSFLSGPSSGLGEVIPINPRPKRQVASKPKRPLWRWLTR